MKGEEQLWSILNDKLDNLRASKRLPEAIRVAETALEVAKRAFPDGGSPLATSFEKLGQLLDQKGDRASAKATSGSTSSATDGADDEEHQRDEYPGTEDADRDRQHEQHDE